MRSGPGRGRPVGEQLRLAGVARGPRRVARGGRPGLRSSRGRACTAPDVAEHRRDQAQGDEGRLEVRVIAILSRWEGVEARPPARAGARPRPPDPPSPAGLLYPHPDEIRPIAPERAGGRPGIILVVDVNDNGDLQLRGLGVIGLEDDLVFDRARGDPRRNVTVIRYWPFVGNLARLDLDLDLGVLLDLELGRAGPGPSAPAACRPVGSTPRPP